MTELEMNRWHRFKRSIATSILVRVPVYVISYLILFRLYPALFKGAWQGDLILNYVVAFFICALADTIGAAAGSLTFESIGGNIISPLKKRLQIECVLPILIVIVIIFSNRASYVLAVIYFGFSFFFIFTNNFLLWLWLKRIPKPSN